MLRYYGPLRTLGFRTTLCLVIPLLAVLAACNEDRVPSTSSQPQANGGQTGGTLGELKWELLLPTLSPVPSSTTGRLRVVATTSIIGDVVARVGGDAIELDVLMGPGQDPHGYEPSARDLTRVSDAEVIFVNGWNLEAGLVSVLNQVGEGARVLPISAGITPRLVDNAVDPHVWLDVQNVLQWVDNVELVLGELDPANASVYQFNADSYRRDLEGLVTYMDGRLRDLSPDRRKLVTNHDALGYFADRYELELIGTIIPATDTLAEPSASGLAQLAQQMEDAGVCTIYVETTANDRLARALAGELKSCPDVKVLALHTGAIGPPGSETGSYIGMMRDNVDTILSGQQG